MISDFTSLKAALEEWLGDDDIASRSADFVTLAEASLNRRLRVSPMLATIGPTALPTTLIIQFPADHLAKSSLRLVGSRPLEYRTPEDFWSRVGANVAVAANPQIFTIQSNSYVLAPGSSGGQYLLTYYQKIPALTDTNQTNWLIVQAPDLYLYASLLVSSPYLADRGRLEEWNGMVEKAITELQDSDFRDLMSGLGPIRGEMSPRG